MLLSRLCFLYADRDSKLCTLSPCLLYIIYVFFYNDLMNLINASLPSGVHL